ncbi:MAG: hypothetical protein ACT4PT_13425 [Methanobacteriota archaeon]
MRPIALAAILAIAAVASTVVAHVPSPAPTTDIGPGSRLVITLVEEPNSFRTCTANFVWNGTVNNTTVKKYVGTAGHCILPMGKNASHGPGLGADYNLSRTNVSACVANCSFGPMLQSLGGPPRFVAIGPVAYARQSWNGSSLGYDFALIEVNASLWPSLRTTMPVWGGPTGRGEVSAGAGLCLYGTGFAVGEAFPTMARAGVGLRSPGDSGWFTAALPGNQGDSGAPLVLCGPETGTPSPGLHGSLAAGIVTGITAGAALDIENPDRAASSGVVGIGMSRARSLATEANLTVDVAIG